MDTHTRAARGERADDCRMVHGAVRVGRRLVSGKQWATSRTSALLRAGQLFSGHMDRPGHGSVVRAGMPQHRGGRGVFIARRLDDYACGYTVMVKAPQRRCSPKVRVPMWHSTQRISQFDSQPGRLRLRWLASQHPRPLPLPRWLRVSSLLHRMGGPCDFRRHSQCARARFQARSITSSENSKSAAMRVLYRMPKRYSTAVQ